MISVMIQDEILKQKLQKIPKDAPMVLTRALRRGLQTAGSETKKTIRDEYPLKAKEIASTLNFKKPTKSNLTAKMISKGNKLGVVHFKISPAVSTGKRKLLKITINKKKGPITLSAGFAKEVKKYFDATSLSPNIRVFVREGSDRYPVKRIYGPSVPELVGSKSVMARIEAEATSMVIKRLNHEIIRLGEKR